MQTKDVWKVHWQTTNVRTYTSIHAYNDASSGNTWKVWWQKTENKQTTSCISFVLFHILNTYMCITINTFKVYTNVTQTKSEGCNVEEYGSRPHAYIHTHIHAYIHTCMHAYIHTYMHKYIYTYIRAHIFTHEIMQTKDIWKVRWQKTKEVGWYSTGYVLVCMYICVRVCVYN